MAIGDILKASIKQTFGTGGKPLGMEFFYRIDDADGTASNLALAMMEDDAILDLINMLQTDNIKNSSVTVINLFSLTDFAEFAWSGTGEVGTDGYAIHDALNITLKLNTRGIRPGRKSIGGLVESSFTNGLLTDATMIGRLDDVLVALAEPLVHTSTGAVFTPVVVKRIKETAGSPPVTTYRLPEDTDELDYGTVVAALSSNKMSHNVSRGND